MIEPAPQHTLIEEEPKSLPLALVGVILLLLCVLFVSGLVFFANSAPSSFRTETDIAIPEGSTVDTIGEILAGEGYVRSPFFFKLITRALHPDISIQAGSYQFTETLSTSEVIEALGNGSAQSPHHEITFPEGFTVYDIRTYTGDFFTAIDLESIVPYEGYLFPDTYFVAQNETLAELVERMRREYEKNIAPLREKIAESGYTEEEVIILASILEREANDETSMRTVAGILENRLTNNIALQVDATFEYILGKTSEELTLEDLALDSPYNTYKNRGLPPTPIANPGLMAIEAVLNPLASEYLFYLTGNDGTFHYAESFEEHKRNKELYLR